MLYNNVPPYGIGSEHVTVVGVLAKDGGVDAFDLFLLADADRGDLVDDPEDGVGEYEAIDGGEEGGCYLLEEEVASAPMGKIDL